LAFCLDDGTPLSVENSEATRIIPAGGIVPGATIPSIAPQTQPPRPTYSSQAITSSPRKTNPLLYVIVALLALIAGGGLVALLMFGSSSRKNPAENSAASNQPDSVRQQERDLQNQQAELERERQRLEDERKKLQSDKTNPVETTAPAVDSPARISFGRGNTEETISGVVARSKSYVLKASAGQYLAASVTSNGCVVFSTGTTSMNYVTANGDNWITVTNNCGSQTPFNLTVSVR